MYVHTNIKAGMTFVETMIFFFVYDCRTLLMTKELWYPYISTDSKRVFLRMSDFCFSYVR